MRNPDRIDSITETIRRFWHTVPDWRLGQLITNACRKVNIWDVFFAEEDDLEVGLRALQAEFNNQQEGNYMVVLHRQHCSTIQEAVDAAERNCGGTNFEIRSNPDRTYDLIWSSLEEDANQTGGAK